MSVAAAPVAGRRRVVGGAALFVLGFGAVFTVLGATASALGSFLVERLALLNRIAGVIIIAMGIAFLSTVFVPAFTRWAAAGGAAGAAGRAGLRVARIFGQERGVHARPRSGLAGAFPLGAAFAIGWTPCVGPGLGTILTLAAAEGSVARGAILLGVFSLGFGVWFLAGAWAFGRAATAFDGIRRHMRALNVAGGVLLLVLGLLMVTGLWSEMIANVQRLLVNSTPFFEDTVLASAGGEGALLGALGFPLAFLIGALSFFTPCVLPLVPGYLAYISGLGGEQMATAP